MPKKANILIICFSFPPFPGIGGRRWAKFAKELAQNYFNVHVLGAENSSTQQSEWIADPKHQNIKLHTFPLGLSKVFSFYPKTVWEKIVYRLLSFKGSLQIKGNKQDKTFFIKDAILSAAQKLITENKIDTLIITIPPYKLAYYLLPLKEKFPSLKFIVDYRDPWTDNKSYHGFATISESDLKAEIEFEKEVLKTADVVLDVNKYSLEVLKVKSTSKARFIHLPNVYDLQDYNSLIPKSNDSPVKRFIYSGSFYPNLMNSLTQLILSLKKVEIENPTLYKMLRFDFYGNMDHEAIALLKQSNCSAITFHGNLSQKQIFDEINDSDYCMLFSASDHQHTFNTKFYEYLYFKKPILYFGNKGETSDFITNNSIGLVFTPENLNNALYDFLISSQLNNFKYNLNLDISGYELKNVSQKLIRLINE